MAIKKITSEEIIESALNFIKEKGYENLNARSLASHLKCSTQPIYFQFQNMNDLKLNVLKKAKEHYETYILTNLKKENTLFMGCLKGMINYAKEYKNIFSFIFEKPFVVFDRQDDTADMMSRIENLLKTFSIERKYAYSGMENDLFESDYQIGHTILNEKRKESIKYLENLSDSSGK